MRLSPTDLAASVRKWAEPDTGAESGAAREDTTVETFATTLAGLELDGCDNVIGDALALEIIRRAMGLEE